MLELCSRSLDEDLNPEELREMERLRSQHPLEFDRFQKSSLQLRSLLRSVPCGPVSPGLKASIGREILGSGSATGEVRPVEQTRRGSRWVAGSVSVAVLACSLLIMILNRGGRGIPATDADRGLATAMSDSPAAGSVVESRGGGEMAAEPPAAELSVAAARTSQGTGVPELSDQIPDQIHSGGDNWQIVVIRIPTQDQQEAVSRIEAVARDYGLEIQSRDEQGAELPEAPDAYGFILTTAPLASRQLVEGIMTSGLAQSSEWNPSIAASMSRDELIRRIGRSMLSPTASEQHFGRMFIAVAQSEPAIASADAAGEQTGIAPPEALAGTDRSGLPAAPVGTENAADESKADPDPSALKTNRAVAAMDRSGNATSAAGGLVPQSGDQIPVPSVPGRTDETAAGEIAAGDTTAVAGGQYVLVVLEFTRPADPGDCVEPPSAL